MNSRGHVEVRFYDWNQRFVQTIETTVKLSTTTLLALFSAVRLQWCVCWIVELCVNFPGFSLSALISSSWIKLPLAPVSILNSTIVWLTDRGAVYLADQRSKSLVTVRCHLHHVTAFWWNFFHWNHHSIHPMSFLLIFGETHFCIMKSTHTLAHFP